MLQSYSNGMVVVAGGDGTLSEAISGAIRLPEQPVIGYIPVGTTNDFSNNLDLPSDKPADLAVTAVTGNVQIHDLGRFNEQNFLYVAAFGALSDVSYNTPQKAKNLLGYNAYMLGPCSVCPPPCGRPTMSRWSMCTRSSRGITSTAW